MWEMITDDAGLHMVYYGADGETVKDKTVTINKKKYTFNKNGLLKNSFKKYEGKKYYFRSSGNAAMKTAFKAYNGKYYYAYADGHLRTKGGKFTRNGKMYFSRKSGVLYRNSFIRRKTNVYYAGSNCALKKGTFTWKYKGKYKVVVKADKKTGKINYNWFRSRKVYGKGAKVFYTECDKNLYNAYRWCARIRYKRFPKNPFAGDAWYKQHGYNKDPYQGMIDMANMGFDTKTGNCFTMASTFYCIAKSQGYSIHLKKGYVAGRWPHYWTQMGNLIVDANFKNETGGNGWKIHYGQSGTWRYTGFRTICS